MFKATTTRVVSGCCLFEANDAVSTLRVQPASVVPPFYAGFRSFCSFSVPSLSWLETATELCWIAYAGAWLWQAFSF